VTPPTAEPAMSTHLPAMASDDDDELPRRRRLPIVAVLLVLILLAVGIVAVTRKSSTVAIDAGVAPADATIARDAPGDAAPDALDRHRGRRDHEGLTLGGEISDLAAIVDGVELPLRVARDGAHRDLGVVREEQAAVARDEIGEELRLLVDEELGEAVVAHRDRQ